MKALLASCLAFLLLVLSLGLAPSAEACQGGGPPQIGGNWATRNGQLLLIYANAPKPGSFLVANQGPGTVTLRVEDPNGSVVSEVLVSPGQQLGSGIPQGGSAWVVDHPNGDDSQGAAGTWTYTPV